jgi:hypothetical protein
VTRDEFLYELEGIIAAAREVTRLAQALDEAQAEIAKLRARLERRAA